MSNQSWHHLKSLHSFNFNQMDYVTFLNPEAAGWNVQLRLDQLRRWPVETRLEKLNSSAGHHIFSHCVNWMIFFFTLVSPSPSSICNWNDKIMHNLNWTRLPAEKLEVLVAKGSRWSAWELGSQFLNSVWFCIFLFHFWTTRIPKFTPLIVSTLLCRPGREAQTQRQFTLQGN